MTSPDVSLEEAKALAVEELEEFRRGNSGLTLISRGIALSDSSLNSRPLKDIHGISSDGRTPDDQTGWMSWVDELDPEVQRRCYSLPPKKPRRSRDPVVAYAASLGKAVYRVAAGGLAIYSSISPREYADLTNMSVTSAKKAMILVEMVRDDEEMLDDVLKATFKYPRLKSRYSLETHWCAQTQTQRQPTARMWKRALAQAFREGHEGQKVLDEALDEAISENVSLEQERQDHLREIEKYRNALWELGIDPDTLADLPG